MAGKEAGISNYSATKPLLEFILRAGRGQGIQVDNVTRFAAPEKAARDDPAHRSNCRSDDRYNQHPYYRYALNEPE